ncbi:hypothetical protein H8S75_08930 [Hungatella sp. L12]|uniref:Uncharacterized protein n=2 Tax=Hungatella hominis TaxID=2763050 RepID=A0ABR7H4C8_9FIRM|nr:hypothetical protein [Hungatella hominis]
MTDNELLLAMSDLIDKKMTEQLQPLKQDVRDMKQDIQELKQESRDMKQDIQNIKQDIRKINLRIENEINPNINLILENYVPASKRYEDTSDKIEAMQADIDLLKIVVTEHSGKLQAIS